MARERRNNHAALLRATGGRCAAALWAAAVRHGRGGRGGGPFFSGFVFFRVRSPVFVLQRRQVLPSIPPSRESTVPNFCALALRAASLYVGVLGVQFWNLEIPLARRNRHACHATPVAARLPAPRTARGYCWHGRRLQAESAGSHRHSTERSALMGGRLTQLCTRRRGPERRPAQLLLSALLHASQLQHLCVQRNKKAHRQRVEPSSVPTHTRPLRCCPRQP